MEKRSNIWADIRNVYNPDLATTVTKKMKIKMKVNMKGKKKNSGHNKVDGCRKLMT